MKKIFTLILITCTLAGANAQSTTITPADSVSVTAVDSSLYSTINGLIFLHNNLSDSVTVKWRLLSDTIPTGWTILFCDNRNCYNLPTTQTSLPIAPGDSIDMHAEFSPACISGSGTMRISGVVLKGDSTIASYTFTYTANITEACVSAINNVNALPSVAIFPNPASDQISVTGINYGSQITLQIVDMQGRVISTENKIAGNIVSIGVSSLPAGLYLIKVTDQETNQTTIRKFARN